MQNVPVDADGDGEPDARECDAEGCPDTDKDGIPNNEDSDDDGDHVSTLLELKDEAKYGSDVDRDGIPNHLDKDSDNDGKPDSKEEGDTDHDGTPDYLDNDLEVQGGSCSVRGQRPTDSAALWWSALAGYLVRARKRRERHDTSRPSEDPPM
jgi:hypothetical protein